MTAILPPCRQAASLCPGFNSSRKPASFFFFFSGSSSGETGHSRFSFFSAGPFSRLSAPCFAGFSREKKSICPLGFSSSSSSKSRIFPYAPSKPGVRFTLPSLSLRIPSSIRGPAILPISSGGISRRMANSGPSFSSILPYSLCAFTLAEAHPMEAAITSGRETGFQTFLRLPGQSPPAGLPAVLFCGKLRW